MTLYREGSSSAIAHLKSESKTPKGIEKVTLSIQEKRRKQSKINGVN